MWSAFSCCLSANKTLLLFPFHADAQNSKSFQSHNVVTSQAVFTGILFFLINFSWEHSSFQKFWSCGVKETSCKLLQGLRKGEVTSWMRL